MVGRSARQACWLGMALVVGLAAPASRAEAGAAVPALAPEARATFWGSPEDPPPPKLDARIQEIEGRHYLSCDERFIDLFYPHIKDLGGGYAGVGTDQAYFFAGWMHADLVWLTDYDPWVRALHRVYRELFFAAETPEQFLALLDRPSRKRVFALLEEKLPAGPDKKLAIQVFRYTAGAVLPRLKAKIGRYRKAGIPSFLTDAAQYAHVRDLVRRDRVRPMLANLLAERGVRGVGEAARKLGVPIRVLYLSNAEEYWPYSDQYRANVKALAFDDRSVILRTDAAKTLNGDYRYNVQPAKNYLAWLGEPWVKRVNQIVGPVWVRGHDHVPLTVTNEAPFRRDAAK